MSEWLKEQVRIQTLIADAEILGVDLADYSREEIAHLTFDDIEQMASLDLNL